MFDIVNSSEIKVISHAIIYDFRHLKARRIL